MKSPKIAVSWGELIDRITILEIKLVQLSHQDALANVEKEHKHLEDVYSRHILGKDKVNELFEELREINKRLWDIEDSLREKERDKCFDQEFIELARSVYLTNDHRSRTKRRINEMLQSDLIEEKSYSTYR
ncbi:DUF6165 family protein [Pseudomonadales bacterium]|jgi:hypothetical protein|nr:DUF6165 family protein [Pseudomonadales bacterium]